MVTNQNMRYVKKFIKWNIKKSPGSEEKRITEVKNMYQFKTKPFKIYKGLIYHRYRPGNTERQLGAAITEQTIERAQYNKTLYPFGDFLPQILVWSLVGGNNLNNLRQKLLVRQGFNQLILLLGNLDNHEKVKYLLTTDIKQILYVIIV